MLTVNTLNRIQERLIFCFVLFLEVYNHRVGPIIQFIGYAVSFLIQHRSAWAVAAKIEKRWQLSKKQRQWLVNNGRVDTIIFPDSGWEGRRRIRLWDSGWSKVIFCSETAWGKKRLGRGGRRRPRSPLVSGHELSCGPPRGRTKHWPAAGQGQMSP